MREAMLMAPRKRNGGMLPSENLGAIEGGKLGRDDANRRPYAINRLAGLLAGEGASWLAIEDSENGHGMFPL